MWEGSMARRNRIRPGPSRRSFLAGAAAAATSATIGIGAPAVLAQAAKPLRLGILNTFTGINANPTASNLNGMSLYFDRIGWTVAGRKIELVKEDDQFNPQIGLQKIRKLVENDQVDLVCGPQGSNVAIAVLNYCKETRTIMLVWAGTDSITWERVPILFRPGLTSWQLATPMATWVFDNVAKELVLIGDDFAAAHDVMAEFKRTYVPKGGKILKEIYPPLGTGDYSAYLTDILSIAPPAVYGFFAGTDAVRFVQQFKSLGLSDKMQLTGFAPLTDGSTIPAQGDAALGVITTEMYVDTLDNAANKAFVGEYRARFNSYPDTFSVYGYDTARIVEDAVKATDGDTSNKDRLIAALAKISFDSPRGRFSFDPVTHNPIQNVYVAKVAKVDGRLTQTVVATIDQVRDPSVKPS
jgi:branched-chain amino acid transport system substrate-binding protein